MLNCYQTKFKEIRQADREDPAGAEMKRTETMINDRKVLFSGMQATGNLTLGKLSGGPEKLDYFKR